MLPTKRCRGSRCHEMFDDDAVFEHRHLGVAGALVRRFRANRVADHHHPLDRLAAGQEFGLAQDRRTAPPGIAAVAAALALGLQPGRSGDALNLAVVLVVAVFSPRAFMHDGVGRVVGRNVVVVPSRRTCAACADGGGGWRRQRQSFRRRRCRRRSRRRSPRPGRRTVRRRSRRPRRRRPAPRDPGHVRGDRGGGACLGARPGLRRSLDRRRRSRRSRRLRVSG